MRTIRLVPQVGSGRRQNQRHGPSVQNQALSICENCRKEGSLKPDYNTDMIRNKPRKNIPQCRDTAPVYLVLGQVASSPRPTRPTGRAYAQIGPEDFASFGALIVRIRRVLGGMLCYIHNQEPQKRNW